MSREEKKWNESLDGFYRRSYIVYFLHKDITPRELKYINKEMDRNKSYFRGIIIFVEEEQFLKHPKFININIEEIYTILYDKNVWDVFEKIKDEDYMKDRVLEIFGDEYTRLKAYMYEIYYLKHDDVYTYVIPMSFADFAKMDWINYMVNSRDYSNVELKVVCENECVEYVKRFLDENVEICCLERE